MSSVVNHSDILIGDNVFTWGGYRPGLPYVHDSPGKTRITSSINVFDIGTSTFTNRPTTGTPPNGVIGYSSCCIGDDIYYFGGFCKRNDCFHNDLFVLNTTRYRWRNISCDNGPMKKAFCGIIPLCTNGKDYILVIGGHGPIPDHNTPECFKYTPHPSNPPLCLTNEVHIMCVSSTPGKWTVPLITGSEFPPLAGFSINTLPGNRAIVFGGASVVTGEYVRTNDVFILTYSAINNSLDIHKLDLSDPTVQRPIGRSHHSSVVISSVSGNGVRQHYQLVFGGWDTSGVIIADCWIMEIKNKKWIKLSNLPNVLIKRDRHSMSCFKMSINCVWLLITGGRAVSDTFVTSPNTRMIVELVFSPSGDIWRVSNVMNEKDMKNKAQYTRLVFDRLAVREKEYQKENTVPATEKGQQLLTGGGEEQVIESLKQQLRESKQQLREKEKQLREREQENHRITGDLQKRLNHVIEEITQQNFEQLQQNQNTIRQKDHLLQQKNDQLEKNQAEILELQEQLKNRPWILQNEEVELTDIVIGDGAYGKVRVAIFRGARVAAKLLHELIVSRHNKDIFTREMEISSGIHHPNIVQFIGATRIDNPILIYELMATSLHKRLQDDESLTHPQIVSIASDICTAMCYLHQWRPQPILHRDISSPNVLMESLPNDKWRAKLSDFGSANLQLHIKTIVPGNPAYAAPEALIPQHHTPAMDVYSFGILLTEMSLHRAPEMDSSKREKRARSIPWPEMRVIVLQCINNDHSQRLSSLQLLTEFQKL